MEVQKGQVVIDISFRSHENQVNQDSLNTAMRTIPLDPKANAEYGINQNKCTSGYMNNIAKCSGSMGHVRKSRLKLRCCRCPEMTAQDKTRHIIFCISFLTMLLCLIIFFVAFVHMLNRADKSNFTSADVTDDVLLVVFGVAAFVSVLVAFCSQRHAESSILRVARIFVRNSMEWTYISIDKPSDATAGEVI
ncbi:hypothetical protein ACJMK2_042241 [Sinanodonta woodiana]|uniref:Uncharacterized protein n=1 Tax=Sinanodonta woodiana TaxID=1069815 RepID=A0ABD3W9R5_SINWO